MRFVCFGFTVYEREKKRDKRVNSTFWNREAEKMFLTFVFMPAFRDCTVVLSVLQG